MKRFFLIINVLVSVMLVKGQNPIVSNIYTADPAAMVYNDTVYIYTGHDEGLNSYDMSDWQLFSSNNMVNWTAHGEVLNVNAFSWSKGDAWAAEVEERNGKFYFYVCTEHNSIAGKAIGVAVSDSPAGPFVDARGSALVTNDMTTQVSSTWDDIDPTVFIDDDGQAYIYWGNTGCYYAKLKDNMIELDGEINFLELPSYAEAPYIHKKDDIYYLSYAYGWEEQIAYATAPSITGPWTFGKVINNYVNNCNTNHQSIIEFKNQWYFIYHTGDLGGSYQRSVAIDYLFYNEDGTILEIVQTSDGIQSTEQTENCLPLPVHLSCKVNGGNFSSSIDASLQKGDRITIKAEIEDSDGSWLWTGSNGFLASGETMSLNDVTLDHSGTYKAEYTSACGTKSIGLFEVTVLPLNSGKTFTIQPYNTNLRVGLETNSGASGTNVVIGNNLEVDYQRFIITNAEEKYYRISPVLAPGEALDVYNFSSDDGANIVIWEYWGGTGQQYELQPLGDDVYAIIARHSGKCLDWETATNNLIQWTYWGGDNQKFKIEEWVSTSTEVAFKENSIKVYPTPTNGSNLNIDISALSEVDKISILNINGISVYEQNHINSSIIKPNLEGLTSGIYLIMVYEKNQMYTRKIVLQ